MRLNKVLALAGLLIVVALSGAIAPAADQSKSAKAQAKAEKKVEKQTGDAAAAAAALQDQWLTQGSGFNLRRAYLLADGRTCFVFDIGFAPMTALSSPRNVLQPLPEIVQSEEGTGTAQFIDLACTRNGQMRPGRDITQAVLDRMPRPSRLADAK